jgi:hypothetical protein
MAATDDELVPAHFHSPDPELQFMVGTWINTGVRDTQ